MARKSDDDLRIYITDCGRYVPAAIEAAISELSNRGVVIEDKELEKIHNIIEQKKAEETTPLIPDPPIDNIVTDQNAPELYSKATVYTFSTLFGGLIGAILLIININKIRDKKGVAPVLISGFIFFIATIIFIILIPYHYRLFNLRVGLLINVTAGSVLNGFFWNKYIGKEISYRLRSFWTPLIVCVAILIAFIICYYKFAES